MFAALCWTLLSLPLLVSSEQSNITAKPGENVTLRCGAPNNNIPITAVEWSRTDLGKEYVLIYRDGQLYLEGQHPSFKDRVDLQDRQMKDGDVSLILKNVTTADEGTYECRVVQRGTNRRKRANLKSDPISTIRLAVVSPADNRRAHLGLIVPVVGIIITAAAVVVVVALISQKHKKKKSDSPPDEAAVQQLV